MTPATAASAAPSSQTRGWSAHVDAGQRGELLVLAHRPHGAADGGAGEQQVHGDHEHDPPPPSDSSWSGVARAPRPIFMAICNASVK